MPARPSQGGSIGVWGTDLNAHLDVAIDQATGNLKAAAVLAALNGLLSSNGDVTLSSDLDVSGAGDVILKTGGVERGRITAAGVASGVFAGASGTLTRIFNVEAAP